MSKSSSCIKDLVSSLVRAEDCDHLSDGDKAKVSLCSTQLAMKMSECLMKEMRRPFPQDCSDNPSSCRLEGDAWNTFSTFFAHVDNLCHFYW